MVYTNHQSAGAYRGYGATQGIFAMETAVNELADRLGMESGGSSGEKHGPGGAGHARLLQRAGRTPVPWTGA